MMLQALIEYAKRHELGSDDDSLFQWADVHWEIPLNLNGTLAGGPVLLGVTDAKGKLKPKSFKRPFTSDNELSPGKKSRFLCDTLERSVLFLDAKAPEKVSARRVQHAYFQTLLAKAAAHCPTEAPRLAAVLAFLTNEDELAGLHRQLTAKRAKPTHNALFTVARVNFLQVEEVMEFWRAWRRGVKPAVKPGMNPEHRVCIATNEFGATLDTTEKIKGVPGGLPMGTNLISFDKAAFCSYGLEQAQNAALSAPAELRIRSALTRLIETSRRQNLVFNDTIHLHWTREQAVDDHTGTIVHADEKVVLGLIRSVRTGEEGSELDHTAYYAASLSGNGARIVVRDWLESTVKDLKKNVARWFEDLAIISPDGTSTKVNFKLASLLYGLVRKELKDLAPQIPTQLFHSALRGYPLPLTALAAAVRRQQIEPTSDDKLRRGVILARLALIKACLRRSETKFPNEATNPNRTMTESLNSELSNPAYLCGRLFAVFDRLQNLALGGVNAGVVERFYASASVTPALVMGRLFRNAQFHLAKADGGIAENIRKDFEVISSALGTSFPPTLDLEAQGRFALGYYHQKAEYRRRTAARKEQAALAAVDA